MPGFDNEEPMEVMDYWKRVFKTLSAEPRWNLIDTLMDVPEERRLPLPDAANSPDLSISARELPVQLQHYHLPKMAEAGYIRWEEDPFCVQRGSNFEEAAAVVRIIYNSADRLPEQLIDGCPVLEKKVTNERG